MRSEETKALREVMKINFERKIRRENVEKRWLDKIENYMKVVGVFVDDVENLNKWRLRQR